MRKSKKMPNPLAAALLTRAESQQKNPKHSFERFVPVSFRAKEKEDEGSGGGQTRTYTLSFSSEEPYERWFGPEILDHSDGAVDLSRLNEIGVVLYNHDRDKVIGKITKAWIENGRGEAEIEFDDDEDSEKIRKKVESGTLRGVSVGYSVNAWEEVLAGKSSADGHAGPCRIARSWTPFEVSIVSVPADATVGVGRDLEAEAGTDSPAEVPSTRSRYEYYERRIRLNKNKEEYR